MTYWEPVVAVYKIFARFCDGLLYLSAVSGLETRMAFGLFAIKAKPRLPLQSL